MSADPPHAPEAGAPLGPLAVVTGGTGFVGSHVVDELLHCGFRVRCIVRRSSPRRWLEGKPIERVVASFDDAPALAGAVQGATWIVHAAGLTSARHPREFYEANVMGTERVLRAALTVGPGLRRFLAVSSQAAGGPSRDGSPVIEAQPARPVSPYGDSKHRAEELVLQMRDRLPVCCIRPPGVYGPRDEAFLKVFRAVKWRVRPVLRPGGRFSLVHAEDLARAIVLALEHDRAVGEVFYVSEPDVADYDTMGRAVVRALGNPAMRFEPPSWLLMAGALLGEGVSTVTGKPAFLSREKLREITAGDWICSSAKIRERLGWMPSIALDAGIAQTAEWYRAERWL